MRKADLLVINGGQLEIGWLPQIIKQGKYRVLPVQPGGRGFLDLSSMCTFGRCATSVSRNWASAHPEGNPHFFMDPDNIPIIAKAITER